MLGNREDGSRSQTRFADLGDLDQPASAFHHDGSMFSLKSGNVAVLSGDLHYDAVLNTSIGSVEIATTGTGCLDTGQYMYHKGAAIASSLGNGHCIENWGDSGMADNSQQTDTSTDVDTDDRNQLHGVQHCTIAVVDSLEKSKAKAGDQKTLRRLAQNREAARKSRLRKKAYVQQLENSRHRLTQLEQELQRARQQILGNHLEPLTDQQLVGICNLQQSSQQAEDALSQGMEALQQSLVDTVSSTSLGPAGSGKVADYMGQMAIAMGKLATLENFLHQAANSATNESNLTTRQAARALLVINDYTSRLRALSSLWLARPRD
ncbi:hypothetical protein GH714_019745 [Hevea brasiliensis]|uniref:BZIP domain-containing protein n=1 Tax=Hevea brasiliensis TaxID=3981 RepID=A0A6A6ME27_HEVBR|nr:hypothetical protein GH714_019745 [Hevea brasiliensis]